MPLLTDLSSTAGFTVSSTAFSDVHPICTRWLTWVPSQLATCQAWCISDACVPCARPRRQALSDPETVRRSMDPANIQAMLQMQAAMQQLQASGLMPADAAAGMMPGMMPGLGGVPPASGVFCTHFVSVLYQGAVLR